MLDTGRDPCVVRRGIGGRLLSDVRPPDSQVRASAATTALTASHARN